MAADLNTKRTKESCCHEVQQTEAEKRAAKIGPKLTETHAKNAHSSKPIVDSPRCQNRCYSNSSNFPFEYVTPTIFSSNVINSEDLSKRSSSMTIVYQMEVTRVAMQPLPDGDVSTGRFRPAIGGLVLR